MINHKISVDLIRSSLVPSFKRCCCIKPQELQPVVTVMNAASSIGQNVAFLLKQSPFVNELCLYDTDDELFNIAEDISHIDTKTKVRSFMGRRALKNAMQNSHIILQVGGCQTKPGESTKKMFNRNVDNVRNSAIYAAEFNPSAIFCIQTPPIECFVPLVSEEYKKAGVYNKKKIIGITSTAAMRANHFVGKATNNDPTHILLPIVGGTGPQTTVAVISQVRPKMNIAHATVSMLQRSISQAENNALKLFKEPGSVCLSQSIGVCRFVNNLLKAMLGETNCVDCAFVGQTGHIEAFLPYMTSIVRLGRHGVISTHMPKINEQEAYVLKKASLFIKSNIALGESFSVGTNFEEHKDCKLVAPKKIEGAEGVKESSQIQQCANTY